MTSASMGTKIVRVKIEADKTGLYFATSPDLKGLFVAERTIEELERSITKAVTDLYAACGVKVVVSKAGDGAVLGDYAPWVAVPADLARAALDETRQ